MIRKLALGMTGLLFAVVVGFELGSANAYAAAKKVDCEKVMSELNSGKKAKDVATDLKISTSSVYRCKKKAAKTAGAKGASPAASPAAAPSSTPAHK